MKIEFEGCLPVVLIVEALARAGIAVVQDRRGGLIAQPSNELALVLQHTPSAPKVTP